LERCQGALERAVSELADFRSNGGVVPGNVSARSTALRLRTEVLRAARLLQSLAHFYHGWERILGTMSDGYTASGDAAPVTRRSRLCYRG
jgi:hypothetical protein